MTAYVFTAQIEWSGDSEREAQDVYEKLRDAVGRIMKEHALERDGDRARVTVEPNPYAQSKLVREINVDGIAEEVPS